MPYLRRVYRLAAELEESLVADLWQAGTLGLSTETEPDGRLRLTAWFGARGASAPPVPPVPLTTVECLSEDEIPDVDWMAEYRLRAAPFPLGGRLLIDPREPEEAAAAAPVPAGRRLLRLPARTAFGIGSHESTALALELLEAAALAGRSVLDVGTGTGILAFAALAWGASRVVAFDADPLAVVQARANSRLNGIHPHLFAGRAAALAPRGEGAGRFDVMIVNVVPEEILPELADLLPLLAAGGTLVLSGLLVERAAAVSARLAACGLHEIGPPRVSGEWTALQLSQAQP